MTWKEFLAVLFGIAQKGIVISEIAIKDPAVTVEMFNLSGSENNWSMIVEKIPQRKKTAEEGGRTFAIGTILIKNVKLDAKNHALSEKIIHLRPITKIEITRKPNQAPLTPEEIFFNVFMALMEKIAGRLEFKEFGQEFRNLPFNVVDDVAHDASSTVQGGANFIQEKLEQVKDAVENLLPSRQ